MDTTLIQYRQVTYKKFIAELLKVYAAYKEDTRSGEAEIALCMGKTTMTVRNCFQPMEQVVSDKVLTGLMKCIRLKGKIEWINAERHYYIENN